MFSIPSHVAAVKPGNKFPTSWKVWPLFYAHWASVSVLCWGDPREIINQPACLQYPHPWVIRRALFPTDGTTVAWRPLCSSTISRSQQCQAGLFHKPPANRFELYGEPFLHISPGLFAYWTIHGQAKLIQVYRMGNFIETLHRHRSDIQPAILH